MSKFNLKKFILEGQLDKNLQQLNENSTDVEEDFILKVAGEVDGEGMAQIAGALGINTSEIDLDDEMFLDDLYVDIEMAVKNASSKEIIRLANKLKGLNENLQQLNENSPGYDTRKSGEPLPTLESVKAAFEAKEKDKVKEQFSTMGEYVGKMDLDDHLDNIHYEFEKFQAMTTTEITDIPPAKEELISYVVDYLRNTL